ncbi:MAG: glycosyltransferase [Thermoprotei archaeon]|nr:glycosyltransferase [Thermoprotei archaeon]
MPHKIYDLGVRIYLKRIKGSPKVLTNSTWTRDLILKAYGVDAELLPPPINLEAYRKAFSYKDRGKTVVTVSRFSPEKDFSIVLKAASVLREYHFIIAGSTSKYSGLVLKSLRGAIRKYDLNNVSIIENPDRGELINVLARSTFYLHPKYPEHFGVAIVEAVASGCIPLVYRDGGSWKDVVSQISDELGYTDVADIVRAVKKIEENEGLRETLRFKGLQTVKQFDYNIFKSKLKSIVESIASRTAERH